MFEGMEKQANWHVTPLYNSLNITNHRFQKFIQPQDALYVVFVSKRWRIFLITLSPHRLKISNSRVNFLRKPSKCFV